MVFANGSPAASGLLRVARGVLAICLLTLARSTLAQATPAEVDDKRGKFVQAGTALAEAKRNLAEVRRAHEAAENAFDEAAQAGSTDLQSHAQRLRRAALDVDVAQVAVDAASARKDDARQALYAVLIGKPADRQTQRNIALQARRSGKPSDAESQMLADAAKAQDMVADIKEKSAAAFKLTDEGSALALSLAIDRLKASESDPKDKRNALLALQDAAAGRLAAQNSYALRDGAQKLGNLVMDQASRLAECRLNSDSPECQDLRADGQQLVDELKRRSERAAAEQKAAKLAKFTVQARELSNDEREQRAALAYLQLVDRNPNAGWQFGGEAATLTAGADGALASIRFSLKRFERTWENDTTLTLSAPLSDEGRTRLLSSASADRPKETTARVETIVMRNLNPSTNMLGNYNQLGAFAQVSRQRFDVADKGDLNADPRRESRTAFSAGLSNLFGFSSASDEDAVSAVHRLGFEVRRSYKAGPETVRCAAQPVPGETTLSCAAGAFDPVKGEWKRVLNYRYRKEFGNRIAIAPALAYEQSTRTKSYDLPIYLLQGSGDDQSKFTAGVAYRRVSAPGKETASGWELFVSSPLALFGP